MTTMRAFLLTLVLTMALSGPPAVAQIRPSPATPRPPVLLPPLPPTVLPSPPVGSPWTSSPTITTPSPVITPVLRPPVYVIDPGGRPSPAPETGGTSDDQDGDGWNVRDDCNDHDTSVHPGASEGRNGRDDNCNGVVDEG